MASPGELLLNVTCGAGRLLPVVVANTITFRKFMQIPSTTFHYQKHTYMRNGEKEKETGKRKKDKENRAKRKKFIQGGKKKFSWRKRESG